MGVINKTTLELNAILGFLEGKTSGLGQGLKVLNNGQVLSTAIEFLKAGNTASSEDGNWKLVIDGSKLTFYRWQTSAWVQIYQVGSAITNRFIINNTAGSLVFINNAGKTRTLVKPSVDQNGTVIGNANGRVAMIHSGELFSINIDNSTEHTDNIQTETTETQSGTDFTYEFTSTEVQAILSYQFSLANVPASTISRLSVYDENDLLLDENDEEYEFSQGNGPAIVTGLNTLELNEELPLPDAYIFKIRLQTSVSVDIQGKTVDLGDGRGSRFVPYLVNKHFNGVQEIIITDTNLASEIATKTLVLADGTTATTQSADDNSTKVSTTAYADVGDLWKAGTINTVTPKDASYGILVPVLNANAPLGSSIDLATPGGMPGMMIKKGDGAGGVAKRYNTLIDADDNFVIVDHYTQTTKVSLNASGFLCELASATTATTQTADDNSNKVATTAYVDTAISAEDLWDRSGTTLSPKTAGDNISTTGNLGIGILAPITALDVRGNARIGDWVSADVSLVGTPASGGDFNIGQSSGSGNVKIVSNSGADLVTVKNNGDFGIGIIPTEKLEVNGTAKANNVILDSTETDGDILAITGDSLIAGTAVSISSASASDVIKNLVELKHTGTGDSTNAIDINLGTSNGSVLNGYSSNTTQPALRLDSNSLTFGAVAHFASNSADTNIRKLVHIQNANAASVGTTGLVIDQASTGKAISTNGNITAGSYDGVLNDGVTATTQSSGDNSTKVATTAYTDAIQTLYSANGELTSTRGVIGENGKSLTFEMFNPTEDDYTTKTAIIQAADQIDLLQVTGDGSGDEGAYLGIRLGQGATNKLEFIDEKYSKGAVYNADYSTNFTDRSIVDKAYVDNAIAAINPSGTHDILTAAQLEALATGSVITVSADLVLNIKADISSDVVYVMQAGATLYINYSSGASYTYTGSSNQFSGSGGSLFIRGGRMTASGSSATLFNNTFTTPFEAINIKEVLFFGYSGGSLSGRGSFVFEGCSFIDYRGSLTIEGHSSCKFLNVNGYSATVFPAVAVFEIKRGYGGTAVNILNVGAWSLYNGSLVRIDPAIGDESKTIINDEVINLGDLFDTSGTTGTFTAVADASYGNITIDNVSDVGGNARFNYTVPALYIGQEVVVSNFLTYTAYNKTGIVSAVSSGSWFELESTPYIGSENGTGEFGVNSVTLTDTATTLADGDSIYLDTTLSTAYDDGTYVYNKQTNSVQVNKTWSTTASGTWSKKGLDHDSCRINAHSNEGQADSVDIASCFSSGNTDTTTTSTSAYLPLDLGTVSLGQANSRFKLLNTTTGEFVYTGSHTIGCTMHASVSALKSGTSRIYDFRFYKTSGTGAAFDAVIASRDITSRVGSLTLTTSATLDPGDTFRVEVFAEENNNDITITDFSMVVE